MVDDDDDGLASINVVRRHTQDIYYYSAKFLEYILV